MKRKVYILCPVTIADDKMTAKLYAYADMLENKGCEVHLPPRDTNQDVDGFDICIENGAAIHMSNEIHIFYNAESKGSHFDMGIAFAMDMLLGLKKKIILVEWNLGDSQYSLASVVEGWIKHQDASKLYPEVDPVNI